VSALSASHSGRAILVKAVEVLKGWREHRGSPVADRRAALAELEHIFLVGA